MHEHAILVEKDKKKLQIVMKVLVSLDEHSRAI